MRRRKSPQEKKSLSYARDRRNTYGENSKGSRKSIPFRKRVRARVQRRAEEAALRRDSKLVDREQMTGIAKRISMSSRWQKWPDEPLGRVLKWRKRNKWAQAYLMEVSKRLSPTQDQNCVLCLGPAQFRWADRGRRKHFLCLKCTEYQITVAAEKKLAAGLEEWREALSKKAKSLKGDPVLVITVPRGPRPEGMAYAALRGELIPSDKLPRLD